MKTMAVSVGIVIKDNNVLLVKSRSSCGYWTIPGGKVEPGETIVEAVVREVMEETGVIVKPSVHVSSRLRTIGNRKYYVSYFLCHIFGTDHLQETNDEIHDLMWFPLDEIDTLKFFSCDDHSIISSLNRGYALFA